MSEKKNKLKVMQETCKLRFSTSVPLSVLKNIGEKNYTQEVIEITFGEKLNIQ